MNNENPKLFKMIGTLHRPSQLYRRFGKRAFDIALTMLTLPVLLPIVSILALLVAFDGGNPFYSLDRIGKNGRVYRMWKLRSTAKNTNTCPEHHLCNDPDQRHEWDSRQNLRNDPRLTMLGRFLQISYLDELPQFFNVLIGDMSLVGPRPMLVSQKALNSGEDYYDLRPGITGLWQVSDQHCTTVAERGDHASHYNRILSLANDLKILAATVKIAQRNT